MNDQLFQLLVISITGDKVAIFGLLVLLAWSAGLLGGSGAGRAVPTPGPIPVPPPPPPVPPAVPLRSAKGSWFSQFEGKYSWVDNGDAPGSNALGVPDADQGIAFLSRTTLGQWFEVHAPNGVVSIEQQTDIGPATSTGRGIDISAAAAERFGYSPKNFPTDGAFQWRAVPAPAAVANLSPVAQAIAYQKVRGTSADTIPIPTPAGDPKWLTQARGFIGFTWSSGQPPATVQAWLNMIAANDPQTAAECQMLSSMGYYAWCGVFVAAMLAYAGKKPIFGATDTEKFPWAFAWENYGTDATSNPQPGDILVFRWAGGGGHVTFYDHEVDDDYYHCTGGNQGSGHVVSTESMPMASCVAIRRPPA